MACQAYKSIRFSSAVEALIGTMNGIIDDYQAQGFTLTVRQLYYQLVARDIVENTERSYKRITSIVNDARIAGLMDWDAIEDRTRAFVRRQRWESGAHILDNAARGYHMDMWENQIYRPFVIIEKEALVGVLEGVCQKYDVPLLAARGYPSGTVLREFVENDVLPFNGQRIRVIHLGDHDPSGIDMSRDLQERLEMFRGSDVILKRIALNMDQIERLKPPPNPAKSSDSRFASYVNQYGTESWELDALTPSYLEALVADQIVNMIDTDLWDERQQEVDSIRAAIKKAAKNL